MAIAHEMDQEAFDEWLATRAAVVQDLGRRCPADRLYRMGKHRVTVHSYCEDGTVTVTISGQFNAVAFERNVFGVDPVSLVECDLPAADEKLGAVLTEEADVETYCDFLQALTSPPDSTGG